jgi:hypothetical protein
MECVHTILMVTISLDVISPDMCSNFRKFVLLGYIELLLMWTNSTVTSPACMFSFLHLSLLG